MVCVGRKGRDILIREYGSLITQSFRDVFGKKRVEFSQAQMIAEYVLEQFNADKFDICSLIYNQFKSILVQEPVLQQLIPFQMETGDKGAAGAGSNGSEAESKEAFTAAPYDFEPAEEEILGKLLPRNLSIQIYRAMLDSAAGEQAARMTAMENATNNAGDMIKSLTLQYNRARQAYITKELIEIISGAEAV